jgi:hypothetical protein
MMKFLYKQGAGIKFGGSHAKVTLFDFLFEVSGSSEDAAGLALPDCTVMLNCSSNRLLGNFKCFAI